MKTLQDAFDAMYLHLAAMKAPSAPMPISTTNNACLYRNPSATPELNNAMCAVGALINDECYTEELECCGADGEPVREALKASGWPVGTPNTRHLYEEAQKIHDYEFDYRLDAMRLLAKELELSVPEVPDGSQE